MTTPLVAIPGGWELIVIVLVIVLLFGAKKLPELARGSGQALRIFKDETKGLAPTTMTTTSPRPSSARSRPGRPRPTARASSAPTTPPPDPTRRRT